ncbi:transposase family protein [Streptomyces sp. NBC_01551]|uniref:integrase catalytic domain-containing protein n=1 Tax=Streptomyces sp. NBC_01551 TaxID=2975876 RepID=UPI002250BC20|nr:transposase family protein [Streptomyces sp. NBC_01551]MCX4529885.1 transposase family protein [Streptomyces sp. NBC_01551]
MVRPLLPVPGWLRGRGGQPEAYCHRAMLDAIRHLVALAPWITTVVDDGTRALLGWAIDLTPTSATVFTSMRMAMVHDPAVSPFGAVPERVRIDRGLEFAADAVEAALGTLTVVMHRLPAFQPHRKGKVERLNLTIEQMLISQLPSSPASPAAPATPTADCTGR